MNLNVFEMVSRSWGKTMSERILTQNRSNDENDEFWIKVNNTANDVNTNWPDWKKKAGGINMRLLTIQQIKSWLKGNIPSGLFGILQEQDSKTANHYETVIIPQKVKEAEETTQRKYDEFIVPTLINKAKRELIEKIENTLELQTWHYDCKHRCQNGKCITLSGYRNCSWYSWQQIKKEEGL